MLSPTAFGEVNLQPLDDRETGDARIKPNVQNTPSRKDDIVLSKPSIQVLPHEIESFFIIIF